MVFAMPVDRGRRCSIVQHRALQKVLDHGPEERPVNCAVGRSGHDAKLRARNGSIETILLIETCQLVSIAGR